MINIFLHITTLCYYILLSCGLFMNTVDLLAIDANLNLRPVAFLKTRKISYAVSDFCFCTMTICILLTYSQTWNMAYLSSLVMGCICYSFDWLLFRSTNDRLCQLETLANNEYSRSAHNTLIIKWLCLQGIKTYMVSIMYEFSREENLTTF